MLSGKIVTAGSWALLGIDLKAIGVGKNALFNSAVQSFTPRTMGGLQQGVDQIYEDFTAKVAARAASSRSRRCVTSPRAASGPAPTRRRAAWSTSSAVSAPRSTRRRRWPVIPADAEINLKSYPAAKNPFEEIAEMFGTSAEVVRTVSILSEIMNTEPVAEAVKVMVDESKAARAPQLRMEPQKTR